MAPCRGSVSVVIPCYNHAHYLPDAVNSLLAQTSPRWEAIIVDDGSTDNTREVAQRFTDSRIGYTYQENRGLSAARNTGIRSAAAEYLCFLDADDALEPQFMQRSIQVMATHTDLAGVYTHTLFIDRSGNTLPLEGRQSAAREAFRGRILQGGFFPVHAAVVRAEVVREVGLFDTQLTSLEDWDLWIRISENYDMACIHEPLVRYRVYPGSMSTDADRMHANRIAVLTKYFGSPQGNCASWPVDKRRAYGFAFRSGARGYLHQDDSGEAWPLMTRAVSIFPALLERLDTFYELACGDQPKGYRGQACLLDVDANGAPILDWLDRLRDGASAEVQSRLPAAYGNAYLALATLSDQAGCWGQARAYLLHALSANPHLLLSWQTMRRLLKLSLGKRLVRTLKHCIGFPSDLTGSESQCRYFIS